MSAGTPSIPTASALKAHQEASFSVAGGRLLLLIFFVLLILALGVRLWRLDSRPFHNDEGVNYFFLERIDELGYYPYSHENYHGPSYFYLAQALRKIVGAVTERIPSLTALDLPDSEYSIRGSAAICGILTILSLLLLRRQEGMRTVLLMALLLAPSPIHVYYSRYAIHESLLLLASLVLWICGYLWWRTERVIHLYLGAAALALTIATKETVIITCFCLGLAFLALGDLKRVVRVFYQQRLHLFCASILLIFLVEALFTGGFRWSGGLRELLSGIQQWVGRNQTDTGHFKPFADYARRIWRVEPSLILPLLIPVGYLLLRPRHALRFFSSPEAALIRSLSVWIVSAALVYSALSYKTPWLMINFTVPAGIAIGWWLAYLFRVSPRLPRLLLSSFSMLLIGGMSWNLWRFNFLYRYGDTNPLAYVHTTDGMLELVREIERLQRVNKELTVLVNVDGYWPLPYYLRRFGPRVHYLPSSNPEVVKANYQVMLLERDRLFSDPQWGRKYYRLSEVEECYAYLRRTP